MKLVARYTLLLLLAFMLASAAAHKFYVAVFQMEYVPQKKVVQITARIFIDDLEKALDAKYATKTYLGSTKEIATTTGFLKQYFTDKIKIQLNDKDAELTLLGRETEDGVLICYFTLPAQKKIQSIKVNNTLLFEAFSEQQNIIHTKVNGNKKSLLLTSNEPQGTLQF